MLPKGEGTNTDYTVYYVYNPYYGLLRSSYAKTSTSLFRMYVHDISADNKTQTSYVIASAPPKSDGTSDNGAIKYMETYEYDAKGRRTSLGTFSDLFAFDTNLTQYAYDNNSNLVSKTIPQISDVDGNVLSDIVERYTYDVMGRILTNTDANGNITRNTYDNMGRVTSIATPNNGVVNYAYNTSANNVVCTEFGKTPVVYSYDVFGRLLSTAYTDSVLTPLLQYTYNERGQILTETAGSQSQTTNAYDSMGRLTAKTTRDIAGNVVYSESYTYQDATSTANSIITKTVQGGAASATSVYTDKYNKYGELTDTIYNGRTHMYIYDLAGRQDKKFEIVNSQYNITDMYAYDVMDNVTVHSDNTGNTARAVYTTRTVFLQKQI